MSKTLSLADITSYREESIKCGKSEDYITALSDLRMKRGKTNE